MNRHLRPCTACVGPTGDRYNNNQQEDTVIVYVQQGPMRNGKHRSVFVFDNGQRIKKLLTKKEIEDYTKDMDRGLGTNVVFLSKINW